MDGIIFDVDGTLWDSTEAVARSWNQAIEANTDFSLSLTADWLKSLFGKTMDEITLALFPSCPKEERDRIGYFALTMKIGYLKRSRCPLPGCCADTGKPFSENRPLYRQQLPVWIYRSFSKNDGTRKIYQRFFMLWSDTGSKK